MRIVIDAMGTDAHPVSDVAGAVLAASDLDAKLILVGDETQIKTELAKHRTAGLKLEVLHAPQHVTMDDKPGIVGKAKPGSSMHIGMNLVRDGHADAFVTMGNTGAAQAIAMLFTLRRIAGVKRPALSVLFKITGRPVIFLDIGANTDCRPDWMVQFAVMGSVYAQKALGLANPRIALLANGEEEGKGSQLVRDTGVLLRATSLNFIGNAEPTDLFQLKADVVVCDGFTGNILVKTFEGATRYLGGIIREEIKRSPIASLGGLLIAPAMRQVRKRIDTAEVG
ncbi:MAG: phosphate acyltransferase PlsX, partial [Armatimonadetes bacterium]|nr:phosphate acyltransferase PlsX [Anaerolineae bacterium]